MLSLNISWYYEGIEKPSAVPARKIGRTRELKILVRSMFIGSDCCYESQMMNAAKLFYLTPKVSSWLQRTVNWRKDGLDHWMDARVYHGRPTNEVRVEVVAVLSSLFTRVSRRCIDLVIREFRRLNINERTTHYQRKYLQATPSSSLPVSASRQLRRRHSSSFFPQLLPSLRRCSWASPYLVNVFGVGKEKLDERRSIPALTRSIEMALSGSGRPRDDPPTRKRKSDEEGDKYSETKEEKL